MIAMSVMAVLSFVSAVIGMAVLLGGVIAVLFTQLRRNTTAIVREENEDLRDRLRTVEASEDRCNERLVELESTTSVLKDMVTGASAVSELATVVAFNHHVVVERLNAIDTLLTRGAR